MAVRNTFFIAGYEPLQRSHQGDHLEISGYGAGYWPLKRYHRGDHQEITGSSEFSSRIQSSDRPIIGRDLIM